MTERTRADEVAPPFPVDSGTRRGSSRPSALAALLRSALFRQAVGLPLGWRHVLGGVAMLRPRGVAAAQQRCQKQTLGYYSYRHLWWTVKIPCDRVRL